MFGLMLKNACGVHEAAREHYRLHYCGTCKSIGKQYSQSARMFLNYDCVFLAEILTALSAEDTAAWEDSYHAFNCFALGDDGVELPFPLRYAATANVLLSALKTDDNLKDSPALIWRLAKRWFNADFDKAENEMTRFGVDMDDIWHWISCQQRRESEKNIPAEAEAALKFFSEPTARITAAIFSRGAALTGHSQDKLYDFGYQLGTLIYIIDALEDEEQDKKKNNFNALQRIYLHVNEEIRHSVAEHLLLLTKQIQMTIQQLPLPDLQKEEYRQRFSTNVAVRVANALEAKKPFIKTVGKNLLSRLGLRVQKAKSFAQFVTQEKPSWIAAPQYALSYMAVMIAPHLPQELNAATEQNLYAAPAFVTVMSGFLSALFFRRRIRRLASIYKKELKRVQKKWKDDPKKKNKAWVVFLVLGIILTIVLLIVCCGICSGCKSDCENCNCGDDCCSNCCDECASNNNNSGSGCDF